MQHWTHLLFVLFGQCKILTLLSYSIIPQGLSEPTRELFHFSVKKASQEFYSGRLTGTLPTLSITNVILTGEEAVQSDHQA